MDRLQKRVDRNPGFLISNCILAELSSQQPFRLQHAFVETVLVSQYLYCYIAYTAYTGSKTLP